MSTPPNSISSYERSFGKSLRSAHYLGLSLYILMLTFFIALTAQYEVQEDRVNNVLSSVKKSFPADYELFSFRASMIDDDVTRVATGQMPKEQVELFLKQSFGDLSVQDQEMSDGTSRLSATMTIAKFENYAAAFSERLGDILTGENIQQSFQLEIILGKYSASENLLKKTSSALLNNKNILEKLSFLLSDEQADSNITLNFLFPDRSNAITDFGEGN